MSGAEGRWSSNVMFINSESSFDDSLALAELRPRRPAPPQAEAASWDQVEGDWTQFKVRAQKQWSKLSNGDFDIVAGKRKDIVAGKRTTLLSVLRKRYGLDQEQGEKEINEWLNTI